MSPLTLYLGQFIGLGLLLMCLALAARPKASLSIISTMIHEPAVLLVAGIVTMLAGVALVVGHNLWSGPPLTVAVTVIGWLTLLKGLAITALPTSRMAAIYRIINDVGRFRLVMIIAAAAGAWMTWTSFAAMPQISV